MVILFLIVVWAVVLGPSIYRRWFDGRVLSSIGSFHSRYLESSHVFIGGHDSSTYYSDPQRGFELPQPKTRAMSPLRSRRLRELDPQGQSPFEPMSLHKNSQALQRRRQILGGLLALLVGLVVLGAIPALRVLWVVGLVELALSAIYIGLLIRAKKINDERVMKVTHLRTDLPGPDAYYYFDDLEDDHEDYLEQDLFLEASADSIAHTGEIPVVAPYDQDYGDIRNLVAHDEFTNRRLRRSHYVFAGTQELDQVDYVGHSERVAVGGGR